MPDWYPLMVASRYLRVAPWDLMKQPAIWQAWAIIADGAEAEAREARAKQNMPAAPEG